MIPPPARPITSIHALQLVLNFVNEHIDNSRSGYTRVILKRIRDYIEALMDHQERIIANQHKYQDR